MTFSILARNPKTGEIGGAAATGNLCVGGWVLNLKVHLDRQQFIKIEIEILPGMQLLIKTGKR